MQWLVDEPETLERERRERLAGGLKVDWVGFALIAMALGSLEVVLDRGQIEDWFSPTRSSSSPRLGRCFVFAILPWEINHKEPIVELRLLFRRQFGMAFLVMLMVGAILFGSTQIMPQLLQTTFPYTAMLSGLAMMPGGLAMLVVMPLVGQVAGTMPAEIHDCHRPNRDRAGDVVFDHAHARCELRPISPGARHIRWSACHSCSFRSTSSLMTGCRRNKPTKPRL